MSGINFVSPAQKAFSREAEREREHADLKLYYHNFAARLSKGIRERLSRAERRIVNKAECKNVECRWRRGNRCNIFANVYGYDGAVLVRF